MEISALTINLESSGIGKSEGVRAEGLHASDLYNDYYRDKDPDRYDRRDEKGEATAPPPILLETGLILETALEEGFARKFAANPGENEQIVRPGEMTWEGEFEGRTVKVHYNPDLLIFNGVTRLGEIKATWLSSKIPHEWLTDAETIDRHRDDIAGAMLNPKLEKYWCPTPETRLLTSDLRYRAAGDWKVGDSILGFDEHSNKQKRRFKHGIVEAVEYRKQPVVRLYLADGTFIDCSENHTWLGRTNIQAKPRWVSTQDLLKSDGHRRQINGQIYHPAPSTFSSCLTSREQGWIAGMYDGEGSLNTANTSGGLRLTISQNAGVVLDEIERCLQKDGFKPFSSFQGSCKSLHISVLSEIFRLLGTYRPIRLLNKWLTLPVPALSGSWVEVEARESMGEQWTTCVQTSTRTFIAQGLASHNTQMQLYCYFLGLRLARLYPIFIAGNYTRPFRTQLVPVDVEFSDEEIEMAFNMCMYHGLTKGLF